MSEISIPIYKVGRTTVLGFLLAIEDPWALAVSEKMPELVLLSTSTSLTCHATSYVDTTLGAGAIFLSLVFICVAMLLVCSRIVRYLGHVYYVLAKVNVSWAFWTNTSGEDKPSQVQYVLFSWKSNQSSLCLIKLFPAILQERLRLTCLM